MKTENKTDIDLLLFDDFEHALRVHHAVGPTGKGESMLVGIRLRTGGIVVFPRSEGSDDPAWETHAHLVPPGGAIVAAPRHVVDRAVAAMPKNSKFVRSSLEEVVECE